MWQIPCTHSPKVEQVEEENTVSGNEGRVSVVGILEGFKKVIEETDLTGLIESLEENEKAKVADLYRDFFTSTG